MIASLHLLATSKSVVHQLETKTHHGFIRIFSSLGVKFLNPWTTAKGTPMFMAPEMILGKVPTYEKDMNEEDGKDMYVKMNGNR